jgi:1-acyl-sn-glycerol-3-phosphate acyltransferase
MRLWGVENIPARGGVLLTANHISVLDPLVLALAPAARGRTVQFMSSREFGDLPVWGWALRKTRQIPVRRGAGDWAAIEQVARVLRGGSIAGIFPEGRVGDGPAVQPGKKGAARIALAAGVPVVPAGIWGTQERWPRTGLRFGRPIRSEIAVVFGRALETNGDPGSRADVRALTDLIMAETARLTARAQSLTGRPPAAIRPPPRILGPNRSNAPEPTPSHAGRGRPAR